MKKKAIVIAMALASGSVFADIQVNWYAQLGFYNNGTGPAPADPNDYVNYSGLSTLAQLIWSPDNVIGAVDALNGVNGYVGGNDILLDTLTVSGDYGNYANGTEVYLNANFGGNVLQDGYIFARIFDDTTPQAGEWYNDGDIVDATVYAFTGVEPPVDYDHNNGDPAIGDELNLPIVPEPSTLAFLGLGGLMMAIRRRRA